MLRAVLFGLVAVSAMACGKSSTETSAKVVPGAAAGKVLEVKGTVTVKHGDAVRPLAVGDTVLADDVVITAADGNVVIELAHNTARWELGPNKQSKVSESIAWNAKKATAQEIDEATAAAGRPAERSAAGTVAASADMEEAAPAEAKADNAAAAPMAPQGALQEPDMQPKGGGAAPPPPPPRPTRRTAPKAPPAPPADIADDEAPAPRRTRGGGKQESSRAESATMGGVTSGGGASAAPSASAAPPGAAPQSASSLLASKAIALHACMVTHGAAADVTLTVDVVSGKASVKLASKSAISAALDRCLKGVVAGVQFSGSAKVTRVVRP